MGITKQSIDRLPKSRTGIEGLDDITSGGLPTGRATLIAGGAGSGKTMLSLQMLVNGARLYNEPGIFVAFEENSRRLMANAGTFGWDLADLQRKKLFVLDAQPNPELVQSGGFDLGGMLAGLAAKAHAMGAQRIVFDALDRVLELLPDQQAQRRELYRLHEWLLEEELTGVITAKVHRENTELQPIDLMHFMVDCALTLNHEVIEGVSQRNLRILKYRGSPFAENESPFVFSAHGIEVAGSLGLGEKVKKVSNERVSTGVERLDAMLDGGYYRGAGILITGSPGTSKTTLAGAFAEAACQRGEKTLFLSFDSDSSEIIRNLATVNIRLERFVKRGLLRMTSAHTGKHSAEVHLMLLKAMVREHQARNVIIDPISALSRDGNEVTAHSVVERLMDWAKSERMTLLCTSLLDRAKLEGENTPLQISTIADTWIHLNYLIHGGERNRALTIVKARGTAHSNQVRELVLRRSRVTLENVYHVGGDVLMGTLRLEKEQALEAERLEKQNEERRKLVEIDLAKVELSGRIQMLERELAAQNSASKLLEEAERKRSVQAARSQSKLLEVRGINGRKSGKKSKR